MRKAFRTILAAFFVLASSPAFASTYARVSNGQAIDVITGPSLSAALSDRFAPGYNPQPYWAQVPDTDTGGAVLQSGARANGNGTFTNPPAAAAKPTTIPALDFIKRFTFAERAAIQGAAKTDNMVSAFQFELTKANSVDLSDPDTVAGTGYLESQGLIASGRAAQILAP